MEENSTDRVIKIFENKNERKKKTKKSHIYVYYIQLNLALWTYPGNWIEDKKKSQALYMWYTYLLNILDDFM